ncbi:MAG TPA: histidine kinase, partial [Pseudonocardiaceae bacterium]|nr:histidine kinase [Pseudonocardiaceae bacterium]
YPELGALSTLIKRRVLLDGKIVSLDACGRPSLSRLQHRMNLHRPSATVVHRVPVAYYVFDLLRLDDRSTLGLPYRQRRELLAELDLTGGPIVLTPYFLDTDGQTMLDTAAQYGLHGVVAKRADSVYQPGRRSRWWVQTALRRTQEVVIGGWVPGTRGPAGMLGALLVGLPTDGGLRYVGQVCLGFADAARRELRDRLTVLEQPASPFTDRVPAQIARHARWVAPQLLGEVCYQRWTPHGRLAHPTWGGLRRGKHPAAVQGPVVLVAAPQSTAGVAQERTAAGEQPEAARPDRSALPGPRVQISPHFLYNALAAVSALVRTDPVRARELLMDFAGFTRYCFQSTIERTTLGDELENVERYLALEQARLEERLQVTMHVVPPLLAVALPFLSLQSVVEHAVRDGIEVLPGGGTLAIALVDAGADCLVTVAAPGPWLAEDGALQLVGDRLRLAFGDDYGLVVDAHASTVRLRVPKIRPVPQHR